MRPSPRIVTTASVVDESLSQPELGGGKGGPRGPSLDISKSPPRVAYTPPLRVPKSRPRSAPLRGSTAYSAQVSRGNSWAAILSPAPQTISNNSINSSSRPTSASCHKAAVNSSGTSMGPIDVTLDGKRPPSYLTSEASMMNTSVVTTRPKTGTAAMRAVTSRPSSAVMGGMNRPISASPSLQHNPHPISVRPFSASPSCGGGSSRSPLTSSGRH